MVDIQPPVPWRIIGDSPRDEAFIPSGGSLRSLRIAERCAQMTPTEAAEIAANWLAERHPDDPYLREYLAARDAAFGADA